SNRGPRGFIVGEALGNGESGDTNLGCHETERCSVWHDQLAAHPSVALRQPKAIGMFADAKPYSITNGSSAAPTNRRPFGFSKRSIFSSTFRCVGWSE